MKHEMGKMAESDGRGRTATEKNMSGREIMFDAAKKLHKQEEVVVTQPVSSDVCI